MNHLAEIKEAGKKMAESQYLIYLEKQKTLEEEYKHILAEPEETKEAEEKEEEKLKTMTLEKQWMYEREKLNKKHVKRMTRVERQHEIDYLMQRLYYGLDDLPVPDEFQHLINTSNPTMNKVNYYNILLSLQDTLKTSYPKVFREGSRSAK